MAAGRTTLLITHEPRLAARADLILYLEAGRVRERGTPAELLRLDGRYAAIHRLQRAVPGSGPQSERYDVAPASAPAPATG